MARAPRARERAAEGGAEARGGTPAGAAARSDTSAALAAPKAARRTGVGPTSQPGRAPDWRGPAEDRSQRTTALPDASGVRAFAMKSAVDPHVSPAGPASISIGRGSFDLSREPSGRRGVVPPELRRATRSCDREVASVRAWCRAAAVPDCFRLPGWFRAGLVCHGGRSDTRIGACGALSESVDDAGAEVSRRPACRPGLPETRRVRA